MAGDVSELFNEKQLYNGDVVGEGGEGEVEELAVQPAGPGITAQKFQSSSAGGDEEGIQRTREAQAVSNTQVSRRKRNAKARANQITFWLETKYEVLHDVCTGLENWKEAASANCDWDVLWSDGAICADRFTKLKPYQKMNHFVGMSSITRKNNLGRNLLRMRKQFPKEYQFFPDTWILPTDLSDFKLQFTAAKNKTFIVKPDNGCQGKGIFLVRDVEKVPVDFTTTYVAQRYVHKPFLLDGYKFDLRLYVLVMGCDPLRIFLHKRGLVRLASEKYVEPTAKNLSQSMVHLTNYAINKLNPNFEENTNPDDAQDGHKRSWEAVQEHLRSEGHDVDTMLAEIEDCIIKTLIAVQPSLSHFYHSCQPEDIENGMCFEILGFDIILDQRLQPRLLEVNHAPSFATESDLDRMVKEEVLADTFTLLNLSPEARRQKKREVRERLEQRAMGVIKKPSMEERMREEQEVALERTEWEDARLNGYKRLYPSEQKEREYMQFHDSAVSIWEVLTGGSSRRTVRLSQPPPCSEDHPEAEGEAAGARKGRKGMTNGEEDQSSNAARRSNGGEKRTAEEIREVAERLMAGESARPRPNGERRRRGREQRDAALQGGYVIPPSTVLAPEVNFGQSPAGADGENDTDMTQQAAGEDELPLAAAIAAAASAQAALEQRPPRPEVQVGDVIRVQTNLGWESVTVRAKRANGRLDIQFRDGEYMRSVLPRIFVEPGQSAQTQTASLLEGGASNRLPQQLPACGPTAPPPTRPRPAGGVPSPASSVPAAIRPGTQSAVVPAVPSRVPPLRPSEDGAAGSLPLSGTIAMPPRPAVATTGATSLETPVGHQLSPEESQSQGGARSRSKSRPAAPPSGRENDSRLRNGVSVAALRDSRLDKLIRVRAMAQTRLQHRPPLDCDEQVKTDRSESRANSRRHTFADK